MREDAGRESTLEIPPDAAYVATARIFGSALARHYAVPEGSIDDVKLALSEACAALVRAAGDRIVIGAALVGDRVRYRVSGGALPDRLTAEDETPTPSSLPGVGLELIRALFDDADVSPGTERSSVVFSVPAG